MRLYMAVLVVGFFMAFSDPINAQVEVGKKWGDWQQVCDITTDGTRVCEIKQIYNQSLICTTETNEQGQTVVRQCRIAGEGDEPGENESQAALRVMESSIGYPADAELPVFATRIGLSLGLFIPRGIMFSVEGADSVSFAVQQCNNRGCLAVIQLTEELQNALRKADTAQITFFISATQNVNVLVSLDGYSKALKSLK